MKTERRRKWMACCLVLVLTVLFIGPEAKVQAAESGLKLNKTSISLYVGNTFQLEITEGYEGGDMFWWWDYPSYASSDNSIVQVDWNGQVTAVGAGSAVITVSYNGTEAKCRVKVKANTCKLSGTEFSIYEGETAGVALTYKKKALSYDSRLYRADSWERCYSGVSITHTGNGKFSLHGQEAGDYYAELIINASDGRSYSAFCTVHVDKVGIDRQDIALAVGKSEVLTAVNASDVAYESEDPSVAGVSADGKIQAAAEGETEIIVTYTDPLGDRRTEYCRLYVTNPVYIPPEGCLIAGERYEPEFTGISYLSNITVASSNESVISVYNNACYMVGAGTATLTIEADGVKFKQKVRVIAPKLSAEYALLVKDKTKTLKVTGADEGSVITWTSSDPSVAKVSKTGKITAKGVGSARITAQVDGAKLYCTVTVVAASGKGVKAVQKGEAVLGAPYSQEKRMQKGYYDCSSFVWRSYKEAGVNLGGVSDYAPTAADLAKKLEAQGKAISYEYLPASELKPGDIIFYSSGYENGRYKNIDHVSMFYGSDLYESFWTGEIYDAGLVIHASGDVHIRNYDGYRTWNIVMIARPYGD